MNSMATTIDSLKSTLDKIFLKEKLESYGKQQKIITETARLKLCRATLLDLIMHEYGSSTLSELVETLYTQHGTKAFQKIEEDEKYFSQNEQWLFYISDKTPVGQVSFFLKNGHYIGQCRFYIPEGEYRLPGRGEFSGNPQNLPLGYAEQSFDLLEKFTGKGYGPEGLQAAVEQIIKPLLNTNPLIYMSMNPDNTPLFKPSKYPFLGLATTTGLGNFPSLLASIKAGFVAGKFVETEGRSRSGLFNGYIRFQYPNPCNEESKNLSEFINSWIQGVKSLNSTNSEFSYNIFLTEESGIIPYIDKPEVVLLYHKLHRQFSLPNPYENKDLIEHFKWLKSQLENEYKSTIEISKFLTSKSSEALTGKKAEALTDSALLVWQYVGNPFIDIYNGKSYLNGMEDQVKALPPISSPTVPK